jgi:hypothetical protein
MKHPGNALEHLSRREREGPAPFAREGEGLRSIRPILNHLNPSPSRFAGPSLSLRERCFRVGFAEG